MKLLLELVEMADDLILETGIDNVEARLNEVREIYAKMVAEGFIDNHRGDLDKKFDELEDKLIQARRKLGMVNSANFTKDEATEFKSKIMRNINIFRKELYDLMIEMGMNEREIDYHVNRIGLDREYGKPVERFTHKPKNNDTESLRFRDHMNRERNLASPNDVGQFVKPKTKANSLKWYQRLFKRN